MRARPPSGALRFLRARAQARCAFKMWKGSRRFCSGVAPGGGRLARSIVGEAPARGPGDFAWAARSAARGLAQHVARGWVAEAPRIGA
eukprot:2604860-Lingulodinium_polyedra.AAC.1